MPADEMPAEQLLPGDIVGIEGGDWTVETVAVTAGQGVAVTAHPLTPGQARTFALAIGQIMRLRAKAGR